MTRAELIARLDGYEWTDFECKKAFSDVPKDAYTTVSAFANTEGGWLLFGVSENNGSLNITGVNPVDFDHVQDSFLTTLRSQQKLNQPIDAKPYVYTINDKRVLAFYIPQNPRQLKPVYLNNNPKDSYLRRGARDERVNDNELQRMLRDASHFNWESGLLYDINIEEAFDAETLAWYTTQFYAQNPNKKQFENPIDFLHEWNFIREESNTLRPTRAAILLFGIERYVRLILSRPVLDYQRIDTSFDNRDNHLRWDDRVLFEENLFNTWRGLIAKYSRIAEHPFRVDPASMRRIDDPPDYIAFREASINLLIHQDYGDSHRKASLKWFTDCMQFWNPGDAFMSTIDLLQKRESDLRNPILVDAFRRIGLSDQAGSGIRAIYHNWRDLGFRHPTINNEKIQKSFELILKKVEAINTFVQTVQKSITPLTLEQGQVLAIATEKEHLSLAETIITLSGNKNLACQTLDSLISLDLLVQVTDTTYIISPNLRARIHEKTNELYQSDNTSKTIDKHSEQVPSKYRASTEQVPSKYRASEEVLDILRLLIVQPMTRKELQEALQLPHREHFSEKYLRPALQSELIEMTIPDKPNSNKQKYKISTLGLSLINK